MTETTVLDFKLSNTFEEFRKHMNAPEQQAMFAQMGVKTFYIGVCKDEPCRATVMFQGPENVLFDIFMNPETKPVVEASGHIYDGTVITRWLAWDDLEALPPTRAVFLLATELQQSWNWSFQ